MAHSPGLGHKIEWIAYLGAAFLALAWKFGKYLYDNSRSPTPMPTRQAILNWFFESSADNAVSWVATVGVVWIAGAVYIERLDWLIGDVLKDVPVHASIAFALGGVMEMSAPALAKILMSRIAPLLTRKGTTT